MSIPINRVYETPESTDGLHVPVDRLWPLGIIKEEAKIDLWFKGITLSTELRKWFGYDPEKWLEFQQRYRAQLENNPALAELKTLCREGKGYPGLCGRR